MKTAACLALCLGLASFSARSGRAADADVRGLQVQLAVEKRLLDVASARWREQLDRERRAAQALESAAGQVLALLGRPPQPVAAAADAISAADASLALSAAQQAMSAALLESRVRAIEHENQALRLGAIEAALQAVGARSPATPLDGGWNLVLDGTRRGVLRLTQVGTLVTGDYAMEDGSSGSLNGTFAAGRLRVERVDANAGRDAVLEGALTADRLEGTWLATIFGRGVAEAGRWVALRQPEVVTPAVPADELEGVATAP